MSFQFLFQIQGLPSALRQRVPLYRHQTRVKGVLSINKVGFFLRFSSKLNFINICLKKKKKNYISKKASLQNTAKFQASLFKSFEYQ